MAMIQKPCGIVDRRPFTSIKPQLLQVMEQHPPAHIEPDLALKHETAGLLPYIQEHRSK